jgi:L-xylulokinase
MESVIVIDIGSSRIKCTLFDFKGKILLMRRENCELSKSPGGIVERDAEYVWEGVFKLLIDIDVFVSEKKHQVKGIICTGAGDGLLLLDGEGSPVTRAVSSLDTRASRELGNWYNTDEAREFYNLAGEIPYAGTPIALLKWFKKHDREAYEKGSYILFIKDWIKYRLTGVICTDFTDSSATLTDISGRYDKDLFTLSGIEDAFWKTIEQIPSHESIGTISDVLLSKLPSLRNIPVFSGVHDCTGSALGAGCCHNGDLCIITGSWAGNDLVVDEPVLDTREKKHWLIRSYAIPGKYLVMSSSPTAFVHLDWFASAHEQEIRKWAENPLEESLVRICDRIVRAVDSDPDLIFHPYLFGSQMVPTASAGFNGMRAWHNVPDMLRAVYEGIGFNYRSHYADLNNNYPILNSTLCGGGSNSIIFTEILAAILGKDFHVSRCPETTSLGAFISATIGLGLYTSYEDACDDICKTYTVSISHNLKLTRMMQEKFQRYEAVRIALEPFWKASVLSQSQ